MKNNIQLLEWLRKKVEENERMIIAQTKTS
jgi:hypothetical protein